MTYYPAYGDPVIYNLTASRSVARRENVPKTLEEIVNETYADPNPFPPFSIELLLIFLAPLCIIAFLILLPIVLLRKQHARHLKTPKPSHRYVK